MTQSLDLLSEIPCYKCIILEPTRAYPENCNPNECQILTEWLMNEAQKRLPKEKHTVIATPSPHR